MGKTGFFTVMCSVLAVTVGLLGVYVMWSTGMVTALSEWISK